MLIKKDTIQAVEAAADIVEVVQRFVPELRKKGANYEACCPFHNEKSPSFVVSGAKGLFKCFGCGEGGGPINFVMKYDKKTYTEAIEYLAGFYNIVVEYNTEYDKKAIADYKEKEQQKLQALLIAQEWYHNALMNAPKDSAAWQELYKRNYDEAVVIDWKLGWAPQSARNIVESLVAKGLYEPAKELGLIGTSNGKNYDKIQNRLVYPIEGINGVICGFGGRYLGDFKTDGWPKWINPSASEWYDKSNTVFGLNRARAEIKQFGYLYFVEGYNDVITLQQNGVPNAVAPCGTSFGEDQIKLIKRQFASSPYIVLCLDGDNAGDKAAFKAIDMFLMHDFRVEVCPMPAGEDPDSYVRAITNNTTYKAA